MSSPELGMDGNEREQFIALCHRAQPRTMVVMDDLTYAIQCKEAVPECVVIYRDNDTGGNNNAYHDFTPAQVVDGYAPAFERWVDSLYQQRRRLEQ